MMKIKSNTDYFNKYYEMCLKEANAMKEKEGSFVDDNSFLISKEYKYFFELHLYSVMEIQSIFDDLKRIAIYCNEVKYNEKSDRYEILKYHYDELNILIINN